ncbi:hypothetical protein LCGC14_3041890, partial [marine sediment metagenome]
AHRTYSVERNPVGMKMIVEDGRTFRFCENGGVAAVSAMLFQSLVPVAATKGEAVANGIVAGATSLTAVISTGATQAEDLYNRGYVMVVEAAQLDPVHLILKSGEFPSSGSTGATLELESPLVDGIGDSEVVTYVQNPYRNVIIHPAPPTALIVGVVVRAIPLDEYGWLATSGPTKVLTDGTILIGESVSASLTTDGSMSAWIPDLATTVNYLPTGNIVSVGASTASSVVWLKYID